MRDFISRERFFIAGVVLLHLIWFAVSVRMGNMHTGDSAEYEQQAVNIREHGSFYAWYWDQPVDNDYHTWRPPVYGIFIFLCKSISASNYFFLFIQSLFGIGSCLLLLYQCLKFPLSFNPRWWILGGLVLFPNWFIVTNSISADMPFLFILMIAFTCLQEYLISGRTNYFIAYNLLLILALFTKPAILYFWIPNLMFCLYLYFQRKQKILLFLPLLFPVMITLWCARNEKVTGYWHFSSVSHINLVNYNANYPLMRRFGNDYADSVSTAIRQEARQKPYAEGVRYTIQRSLAIIAQYPFDYLYFHLKGSLLLFLEPGRGDWIHYFNSPPPDNSSFSLALEEGGIKGLWHYVQRFSIPFLLLLGLLSLWNAGLLLLSVIGLWKGRKVTYVQFLILFLVYITVITGVVGCARYRLTVYPILLLGLVLTRIKRD